MTMTEQGGAPQVTLWRATSRDQPYLGQHSTWALNRHHAESFAAHRESRSGSRLYAEMGVTGLPFALFCVDIALTSTTVHDLRNSAQPPQGQSWEAYVADKVNQAAWEAEGFEWVFFTAGWFFPGDRADQAVLLVDPPQVVGERRLAP
jgi:hypothetical protein